MADLVGDTQARIWYLADHPRLSETARIQMDAAVEGGARRIPRDLVPDMPDRIIAATAVALGLPLVTRGRRIRAAGLDTLW